MSSIVATVAKLSHKQFRAMLKKFRRKKKRQQLAREQEHQELLEQQQRESSPNYKELELERLRNSELFDQFEERESIRKHKQWLMREQQAQIEFRKKQEQIEIEKLKQEEERKRIVAEFEQQQYVENKAAEENQKLKSKKELSSSFGRAKIILEDFRHEVLQKTLSNLPQGDEPWHNPFAPESNAGQNHTQVGQEREQCQFFAKTGCCRFGDSCSRGHPHPSVSCTILIRGMYSHFSIGQTGRADFDTDDILEYEDSERYQDFKNFYFDVLPEFKKYGKVVQFKVCSNHEPHLRGNVYVQFTKEEEAVEAYKNFNGRYYAGKQITCQFTHVIKWRSAICGLSYRKTCPKGINCNFLHTFKNPTDEFWEADRDLLFRNSVRTSHSSRSSHSRSFSERRSSRRDHSSERRRRHRDATPEYRSDSHSRSHRRAKSTDADSDGQENGHYSSSRRRHYESKSESSRRKRKHRGSESDSHSPSPSDHSEQIKKHKKSKHKKEKKSKKSKKEKTSDES